MVNVTVRGFPVYEFETCLLRVQNLMSAKDLVRGCRQIKKNQS
jgi:hypothetical protein